MAPFVPPVAQTPVVREENVTVSPEEAVAETVNGDSSMARSASVPNVMVWLAAPIAKLRLTGVAAL